MLKATKAHTRTYFVPDKLSIGKICLQHLFSSPDHQLSNPHYDPYYQTPSINSAVLINRRYICPTTNRRDPSLVCYRFLETARVFFGTIFTHFTQRWKNRDNVIITCKRRLILFKDWNYFGSVINRE